MNNMSAILGIFHRSAARFPAVRYFYNRLFRNVLLPDKDVLIDWDGQVILVRNPRHSLIGRELVLNGIWERKVTRYISPRIERGMTVLDIGADIGYYTLLFARRVGPGGRVIAFEPIPAAKDRLLENLRLNGHENVTVCDYALFSSNGSVVLESPFELSRINLDKTENGEADIRIETRVFDECVKELDIENVSLVKIDVEGAELDVLHGMVNCLRENHPALLIEVHPEALVQFNRSAQELLGFLKPLQYSFYPVDKPSVSFDDGTLTIYCT